MKSFLIALTVFLATVSDTRAADCTILLDSTSSWPDYPPIITDPAYGFIRPEGDLDDDDRNIVVVDGETINLSCAGDQFQNYKLSGVEFLEARCEDGEFAVTPMDGTEENTLFDFVNLGCDSQPDERANEPGFSCGPDDAGFEIQYGFDTLGGYTALFSICFDEPNALTFYTQHIIYSQNKARDTGNDRPGFKSDGYYDFSVDDKYTQATQSETIEGLTGSSDYVDTSTELYLARGHYSPNSDFIYFSFQDATYYFVDVGPQWQNINAGNWLDIENGCRTFVETHGDDLIVYTGSHGVMQLADTSGDMVDIYLVPETNQLPVPMYYWKVIYNSADKAGIAIISVNNPHITEDEISDYTICTPIEGNEFLAEVGDPNDIYEGIVYACEVSDAAAVFEEMPDLGSIDILG